MKKLFLTLLMFGFTVSCGSVSEGFKLKKSNSGDEFLVEKKNPLVLPPDFSQLPQPGSTNISNENEDDTFESKILNKDNSSQNDLSNSEANSTEDFILKNIKKNEIN